MLPDEQSFSMEGNWVMLMCRGKCWSNG